MSVWMIASTMLRMGRCLVFGTGLTEVETGTTEGENHDTTEDLSRKYQ